MPHLNEYGYLAKIFSFCFELLKFPLDMNLRFITGPKENNNKLSAEHWNRSRHHNFSVRSIQDIHYVETVRIWSCADPHFPAFVLHLSEFSPNAGKCGPEWLRIRTHFTQWLCRHHSRHSCFVEGIVCKSHQKYIRLHRLLELWIKQVLPLS